MLLIRFFTLALVSSGFVLFSIASADQLSLPAADLIAPEVTHQGITQEIVAGSSIPIKAHVTDNRGVQSVILYYRVKGAKDYNQITMAKVGETDDYSATIPKEAVIEPGIEYYIQAVDLAGNVLLHGFSFSPLIVSVSPTSDGGAARAAVLTGGSIAVSNGDSAKGSEKLYKNKWLWIGVGVVAAGIIASQSGSDDSGGVTAKPTTVVVNAPTP